MRPDLEDAVRFALAVKHRRVVAAAVAGRGDAVAASEAARDAGRPVAGLRWHDDAQVVLPGAAHRTAAGVDHERDEEPARGEGGDDVTVWSRELKCASVWVKFVLEVCGFA